MVATMGVSPGHRWRASDALPPELGNLCGGVGHRKTGPRKWSSEPSLTLGQNGTPRARFAPSDTFRLNFSDGPGSNCVKASPWLALRVACPTASPGPGRQHFRTYFACPNSVSTAKRLLLGPLKPQPGLEPGDPFMTRAFLEPNLSHLGTILSE